MIFKEITEKNTVQKRIRLCTVSRIIVKQMGTDYKYMCNSYTVLIKLHLVNRKAKCSPCGKPFLYPHEQQQKRPKESTKQLIPQTFTV